MYGPDMRVRHSLPPIPAPMLEIMDKNKLYVFNVGPKEHIRFMGSFGRFIIPACPEGEDYAGPVTYQAKPGIPSIMPEPVVKSVDGMDVERQWDFNTEGKRFVKDILGTSVGQHASDDLTQHGVFLAAGPVPTEAEIEAAREKLFATYQERVKKADQRYQVNNGMEVGDSGQSVYSISADDVAACRALGLDRPWAKKNVRMVPCPACDESVRPGAAICNHCDAILDEAKARQFFPARFAHETAAVSEAPVKRAYNRKTVAA